jgi:alkylated DNA repair dioxygenase AlkB
MIRCFIHRTTILFRTIHTIPGLHYIPNFLTQNEHDKALDIIKSNPFVNVVQRRQQFYGNTSETLPIEQFQWILDKLYAAKILDYVPDGVFELDRSNEPTQLLVTEYVKNQGIGYHIEDSKYFGDVIVTLSFLNPIYISFKKEKTSEQEEKLLLEPKSMLVLKGDARYSWFHGIMRNREMILPDGKVVPRDENYLRYSITIRRVLDERFAATNKTSRVN